MNQRIKDIFNHLAEEYDNHRKHIIPCFHDFYQVPLLIAPLLSKTANALDMGAGTGLFSYYFQKQLPEARFTLIDLSENMLEIARDRMRDFKQTTYIIGDYSSCDFSEQYDLIISSLSIHHLSDQEKAMLMKKCFKHLNPEGFFVNADLVLGSTPDWEKIYRQEWKESIRNSGLNQEYVQAGIERMKLDREATLADQLSWLKEAGFIEIECLYKFHKFVVITGRKPIG